MVLPQLDEHFLKNCISPVSWTPTGSSVSNFLPLLDGQAQIMSFGNHTTFASQTVVPIVDYVSNAPGGLSLVPLRSTIGAGTELRECRKGNRNFF